MIVRSGLAVSILVMFPSGHPDGNISMRVLGNNGVVLQTASVTVPADAVSINLTVPAAMNQLTPPQMFGYRDVEWSYTVGGAVINGEQRYTVEARAPFGVTADGVRSKLGVEERDLSDSEISLISAYLAFEGMVSPADPLTAADGAGNDLAIRNAIEAQAALTLIPTMTVRVASSEDSGTNKFKRQEIDWALIADQLAGIVADGILVVLPTFDLTASAGALFILAGPATDAFTGA